MMKGFDKMKKVIYAILVCIIIAGIVVIATMGLKADLIYSKNVEIDIYIGKTFEKNDIQSIVSEVFPNERVIIQEIELFEDMVSIKLLDTRTDEELNKKVEELNNKINEKYEVENETEDIEIIHNPKIKLSSIIMPYAVALGISMVIILVYVGVRYRKLGSFKTIVTYILAVVASEMLLLSIIAIARYPINRIVIPLGLILLVVVLTILGFKNEKALSKLVAEENKNK
mgnify:CR=1 FL=1